MERVAGPALLRAAAHWALTEPVTAKIASLHVVDMREGQDLAAPAAPPMGPSQGLAGRMYGELAVFGTFAYSVLVTKSLWVAACLPTRVFIDFLSVVERDILRIAAKVMFDAPQ